MTSEPSTAYVWIWLPGANDPVVCGRLDDKGVRISFTYARSYLARDDAVPVYHPELPLQRGAQHAVSGDRLPLCIDDAMPDAWGRRLVEQRRGAGYSELSELTYLLESGSDRIGALHFQPSSDEPDELAPPAPDLDDLAAAANAVDSAQPLDDRLRAALLHGTSIGGARPKALLRDGDRGVIAKFSSSSDTYPVVQGEFVAMSLARRCGLDVATVRLARSLNRHVLLVDRFDRPADGARPRLVSALTILGLTAYPEGRYATYAALTHHIRSDFETPDRTLRELFGRISFNVLCGNTDDHGRNHAAFVGKGEVLSLTPAYDICPQARSGEFANQAMAYGRDGERESRVGWLVASAPLYRLEVAEAQAIVDEQIAVIERDWHEVCDLAELTSAERAGFWHSQFLNPYALS